MWRRAAGASVLVALIGVGLVIWQWDRMPLAWRNMINPPAGHPPALSDTYVQAVDAYLAAQGITRFSARDIAVLGASATSLHSTAYGLNDYPPVEDWPKILPTLRMLEVFLERCECEISVISSYRNERYNAALGNSPRSQHVDFTAIDFIASRGTPEDWRRILLTMRNEGLFRGGIGIYATFVHVDTRGTNADWDSR